MVPPEAAGGGGAGAPEDGCHFLGRSVGNDAVILTAVALAEPELARAAGGMAFDWRSGLCCYLEENSAANKILTRFFSISNLPLHFYVSLLLLNI